MRMPAQHAETEARSQGLGSSCSESRRQIDESIAGFLAVSWLLMAGLEVVLLLTVSGTMSVDEDLPLFARMALAATELALLAALVVVVFGPLAIGLARWGARRKRGGVVSVLGHLGTFAVAWILLFALGTSWGSFRTTGRFLDDDELRLLMTNPEQMLQHVLQTEMVRLVLVMIGVTLLAVLLACLSKLFRISTLRSLVRPMIVIAGAAISTCMAMAWAGHSLYAHSTEPCLDSHRATLTLGDVYRIAAEDRTGPLRHAIAAMRQREWTERAAEASTSIRVVRRSQITMEQYLAMVDPQRRKPYNVIVILLESLRPDQLKAYGGERDVMPALDELARSSLLFSKAFCQANNSFSGDPCSFSGQYPVRQAGMHIYPKDPPYPRVLIWDVLKALGYRTAIISSQNEGWGRMIDFFDTGGLDTIFHSETAADSAYVESGDSAFSSWIEETKMAGKLDDRVTVDAALQWIDDDPIQPFFAYINLQSSHLPYKVPDEFERPFGPDSIDFNLAFGSYPQDKTEIVKDLYADSLRYMDTQLARLFQHLRETGLIDRTIVVATGDSGEAFYEHGFSAHANKIYNEVMLVPLIVHAPDLAGGISTVPAQQIDIPSTILGLLGLPPHPSFQGVDLIGNAPPPERALYLSIQLPGAQQFGIVRGDYKLIFDVLEQRAMLFDLVRDPGETRDLSLEMPQLADALESRLHTWYSLQVGYYEDRDRMRTEYPPVIVEVGRASDTPR